MACVFQADRLETMACEGCRRAVCLALLRFGLLFGVLVASLH